MNSRRFMPSPEREGEPSYWIQEPLWKGAMSALGQKRTCAAQKAMSALPPKADMCSATRECPLYSRKPRREAQVGYDSLAAFGYLRVLTRPRGGRLRSATTTYPPGLVSVNVCASSARTMRNCAKIAEVFEDKALPAAKRPADHAVPGMIPKDSVSVRQDEKLIADLRGRQAWSFGAVRHLGDRPPAGHGSNSLLVDEEDHTQDHGQREQKSRGTAEPSESIAAACIVVRQSSRITAPIPILSGAGHRPSVLLHFSRSARIVAIAGGSGMPANSRKRVGSSSIQRVA